MSVVKIGQPDAPGKIILAQSAADCGKSRAGMTRAATRGSLDRAVAIQ